MLFQLVKKDFLIVKKYVLIMFAVNSSKRGHMLRTNGALSPF